MTAVDFSDLLNIRRGGADMTSGGGDTRVETISSIGEWECKSSALREILLQTMGAPGGTPGGASCEAAVDLNVEVVDEVDCGHYIKRRLRYNTGPHERISAYMLIPSSLAEPSPGLLCIHQTIDIGKEQIIGNDPSPEGKDLAIALHLVERGFVTFSHDLISAGDRRYPGLDAFDTAPFYEQFPQWSVRGKDLYDISRAIDVMQQMPEIDSQRIGSIGHSLGGGYTIYAMALDPRIKAGVSNCGIWPARMAKNPFGEARTEWWTGRPMLRPYCMTGKPFPIDIHEVIALAAPRAIMNISALNDCQHSIEEGIFTKPSFDNMENHIRKVYKIYGRETRFICTTHYEGHSFKESRREEAYTFLYHQLNT